MAKIDKAIFQFDTCKYNDLDEIMNMSRKMCEHLCNVDEKNVTKFDLSQNANQNLESFFNHTPCFFPFDIENCYYRVFID